MPQKFNKVSATSNFIKNLLNTTYLPLVKTVRDTDYIIEGRLYVYKCNVIKCTKSGYIITGFKNQRDKRPRAEFEMKAEYFFGERNDKLCTNFVSSTEGYDFLTHERLGKYLRSLRDMYGLNLMPLYNCFSNQPLPRHHIYTDRVVSTGLNFNTKVFKVPIRFNTDYTICMENLGMTTFAPAFVKNNNLLSVDNNRFGNEADLTNKYIKLHREGVIHNYPNLRFKHPVVVRFNNIPETKTIKYYLQEDVPIDTVHNDRWYKPVVGEPDSHLYTRTVDKDGVPTYIYYTFTPELSPSEFLFPSDNADFTIADITEAEFEQDKKKYYYISNVDVIIVYSNKEDRDLAISESKEQGLDSFYKIIKYEDFYPHKDDFTNIGVIFRAPVKAEDDPSTIVDKVIDNVESKTTVAIVDFSSEYIYTSCVNFEKFIPELTYYYPLKLGLYPTSGEDISAYKSINPSIGTFDSDVNMFTAVALRKQCSIITPYDPTANYYAKEGNFYVLVHPTQAEFEKDPTKYYLDSDFGGDPTNYWKLIPCTYLTPTTTLYPSDTLFPYDEGKIHCTSDIPYDPDANYYIYDEESGDYLYVEITEEQYNEDPEMFYKDIPHTQVNNSLGKFVRCSPDEKFNMNITYAQVKRDKIGWREKKYIYTEVELTPAQFNANKTKYYKLVEEEYVQCTLDEEFDPETRYFTQSFELVDTEDQWIHLDKEYYLQHSVVVERSYDYDITEENCVLYEEMEDNLYLLIQVPESFSSGIVVLEGDYTNMNTKKICNTADIDLMTDAMLDYLFTSNLKLMEIGTTEIIPFSDTLMEFLLWNAIDGLDSLNNNLDRLSIVIRDTYPKPFKEAFRSNFWFPGYRQVIYEMGKDYNSKYITDNLGYVTKDIEESIYSRYKLSSDEDMPLYIYSYEE